MPEISFPLLSFVNGYPFSSLSVEVNQTALSEKAWEKGMRCACT